MIKFFRVSLKQNFIIYANRKYNVVKRFNAMTNHNTARLSVSTWSLHRSLGRPPFYGPGSAKEQVAAPSTAQTFSLLELPAKIVAQGIGTLEICHFHLPSDNPAYYQQVRAAIESAGVELWSLLIDDGDITHPQHAEHDMGWIKSWIDVAAQVGAKNVRVIAGKQEPNPQTLETSRRNLAQLSTYAHTQGVNVMTENWLNLTPDAASVRWLLDRLEGEVGLCADFGNWRADNKYAELAQIFPYADSCHSKAHFNANGIDADDYRRCLDLCRSSGFAGPHTLIYDGPSDDEFAGLRLEAEIVTGYF